MRNSRSIVMALVLSLLAQVLGMAPINAAAPPQVASEMMALPDPPARPVMPPDVRASQPGLESEGQVQGGDNHVRKLSPTEVGRLEESGSAVVVNEEGLLEFDIGAPGERTRVALYDTETTSGIPVVGLAFLDESEIRAFEANSDPVGGFAFGPQQVLANDLPWSHTHPLGAPFHSCSYLYQYGGNSKDAYVYVCSTDVGNLRWVGNAMAAAIGVVSLSPLLALVGYLAVNLAISFFQQSDGSIKIYVPGTSSVSHYGWVYWYSNNPAWADWYYYVPSGNPWYCYAQKYSSGIYYYVC